MPPLCCINTDKWFCIHKLNYKKELKIRKVKKHNISGN